jgi:putative membrane protein
VLLAEPDENFPPFTVVTAFSDWQPFSLVTLGLAIVAGLYVYGVIRLRAKGVVWPWHRTFFFVVAGLGLLAFATIGGIGAYDDQAISIHMVQHMALGMVAPIFLALGAPVTLALRTLPLRPRRWLVSALHSRVAKVLAFPLFSFALYVATPFALYFSGIYQLTLEHEWLHNLMHIHFVLVGCLFFWPLIGLDPLPGRWPYPARALLMVLSVPFHTVLGLTIMQSKSLLAGSYYRSLHLSWVNPVTDQQLAGGILWAGGELISITMLAVLVAQWMRSADREARRVDRQLDREEALRAREDAWQAQFAPPAETIRPEPASEPLAQSPAETQPQTQRPAGSSAGSNGNSAR